MEIEQRGACIGGRLDRAIEILGDGVEALRGATALVVGDAVLGSLVAKQLLLTGLGKVLVAFADDTNDEGAMQAVAGLLLADPSSALERRGVASVAVAALQAMAPDASVCAHADIGGDANAIVTRLCALGPTLGLCGAGVVVACNCDVFAMSELDAMCRDADVKFVALEARGGDGAVFVDAGSRFLSRARRGVAEELSVDGVSDTALLVSQRSLSLPRGRVVRVEVLCASTGGVIVATMDVMSGRITEYEQRHGATTALRVIDDGGSAALIAVRAAIDRGEGAFVRVLPGVIAVEHRPLREELAMPTIVAPARTSSHGDVVAAEHALHATSSSVLERLRGATRGDGAQHAASAATMTYIASVGAQQSIALLTQQGAVLTQWHVYEAGVGLTASSDDAKAALRKRRVLIVGAGATGCEVATLLAGLEPAEVVVVDHDAISVSNLSRQAAYRDEDVGRSKASALAERLRWQVESRGGTVRGVVAKLGTRSAAETFTVDELRSFSAVMSCVDTAEARRTLQRLCVLAEVPLFDLGTDGLELETNVAIPRCTLMLDEGRDDLRMDFTGAVHTNFGAPRFQCPIGAKVTTDVKAVGHASLLLSWLLTGRLQVDFQVGGEFALLQDFVDRALSEMVRQGMTFDDGEKVPCVPRPDAADETQREFAEAVRQVAAAVAAARQRGLPPAKYDKDDEAHVGLLVAASRLIARSWGVAEYRITARFVRRLMGTLVGATLTPAAAAAALLVTDVIRYFVAVQNDDALNVVRVMRSWSVDLGSMETSRVGRLMVLDGTSTECAQWNVPSICADATPQQVVAAQCCGRGAIEALVGSAWVVLYDSEALVFDSTDDEETISVEKVRVEPVAPTVRERLLRLNTAAVAGSTYLLRVRHRNSKECALLATALLA